MKGPGRYDEIADAAFLVTHAETLLLIVHGGASGDGFSVKSFDPEIAKKIPTLLRAVADAIEQENKEKP